MSEIATPIGLHRVAKLPPKFTKNDSFELTEGPRGLKSCKHVRLVQCAYKKVIWEFILRFRSYGPVEVVFAVIVLRRERFSAITPEP